MMGGIIDFLNLILVEKVGTISIRHKIEKEIVKPPNIYHNRKIYLCKTERITNIKQTKYRVTKDENRKRYDM